MGNVGQPCWACVHPGLPIMQCPIKFGAKILFMVVRRKLISWLCCHHSVNFHTKAVVGMCNEATLKALLSLKRMLFYL